MSEQQPTTTTFEKLVTIWIDQPGLAIDKPDQLYPTLLKGQSLAKIKLDAITEVTAENRQAVIDELAMVKKFHDKIKLTRQPITQFLDQLKKEAMVFERDSDYADDKSLYSQKRKLVEAFDQAELNKAKEQQRIAEREKRITLYLAGLKATIQKTLVERIAAKKRFVIDSMAKWEASLTLENIDAKEAQLVSNRPQLRKEDYDACFKFDFDKINILSHEEDSEMTEKAVSEKWPEDKWKQWLNSRLDQEYGKFFDEVRKDEPYEKYNEQYVQAVGPIINEIRSRMPSIRESLKNAVSEAERLKEIEARAQEQKSQVQEEQSEQLDNVQHEKDMNVMEAEFVQQATAPIVGPTVKVVVFENDKMFLKPFLEIVAKVAALPDFPGIVKKTEYIPGIKFWVNLYEKRLLDQPIKGLKVIEKAKTMVKASATEE